MINRLAASDKKPSVGQYTSLKMLNSCCKSLHNFRNSSDSLKFRIRDWRGLFDKFSKKSIKFLFKTSKFTSPDEPFRKSKSTTNPTWGNSCLNKIRSLGREKGSVPFGKVLMKQA